MAPGRACARRSICTALAPTEVLDGFSLPTYWGRRERNSRRFSVPRQCFAGRAVGWRARIAGSGRVTRYACGA